MPAIIERERMVFTAADKVKPICPVFGQCGGCLFQDIPYAQELARKEKLLKAMFRSARPGLDADIFSPIVASPQPYHYRNRLDLQLRRTKSAGMLMGFTPVEGKGIVPVDACPIGRREISDFIPQLKQKARERLPEKYRRANLVVRCGDDGRVRWGGIGRRSLRMQDDEYFWTELGGRRIFYSLETFFQANLSILPLVMDRIRALEVLDRRTVFLDLYGGVGLFGIALYDLVKKVVLVEDNVHAVKLAKYNADYHQLVSFQIHSGRVESHLTDILEREPAPRKVAMVDPPRAGLGPQVCAALGATRELQTLLYLSCHPESLVRDLKTLSEQNWRVTNVMPFDFFPKTKHIETLVVLKLTEGRNNARK